MSNIIKGKDLGIVISEINPVTKEDLRFKRMFFVGFMDKNQNYKSVHVSYEYAQDKTISKLLDELKLLEE